MKATVYKSKTDAGIIIIPVILLSGNSILLAYKKVWVSINIIMLVLLAGITCLFYTISYNIFGNLLTISCSFLYKKTIDIGSIKKILKSNNFISSPAASQDRMEIQYNKWDKILISPKSKSAFIRHLQSINPGIEVILK